MRLNALLQRLRALTSRVKGGVVQDCPPELYACEVCGKLDCTSTTWLNCRQRLAAAQFMASGDRLALAELKRLRTARDRALQSEFPACSGRERVVACVGEAEPRSGKECTALPGLKICTSERPE